MKIKREKKVKEFLPIVITLETEKEFEFLKGLFCSGPSCEKGNCINYDANLNMIGN